MEYIMPFNTLKTSSFKAQCISTDRVSSVSTTNKAATQLPPEFQALIAIARADPNRAVLKAKPTAQKAGIAVSTLWREVKLKRFPGPIKISDKGVAWINAEVDATLAAKTLMSRSHCLIDLQQFVTALTAPTYL
jgi:predicted DNA-binding transcriptional regulator AlpA